MIFAKSDQKTTLKKHVDNLFKVFDVIKRYLPQNLIEALKIGIFFHDIGKVIPAFQIKELGNMNYEPWDVTHTIPHSFFSAFWIDLSKLSKEYKNFLISAIAYHHWKDGYENYLINGSKEFTKFCEKALEWKEKLKTNVMEEMYDSNLKEYLNLMNLNELWLKGIINGRSFVSYAVPPYKFEYEPLRHGLHKEWILISGFLQRCDHFASFCEEEGESFYNVEKESVSFDKLKEQIEWEITKKIGKVENQIWQIKKIEGITLKNKKNIILIAPTGYGKTEFSFLWSKGQKFIYTLPLRSAVNQIFERAEKIFGSDKPGILHSDADVYLFQRSEQETFRVYELSKQFSYPLIISTGDQFFPYALRPPGYEKVFSIFSYAGLVIDEIQAYDPKACAIIVRFLRYINFLGGSFLLMTATLPKFVYDAIKEIDFYEINIYEEEKQELSRVFKNKLEIIEIENEEKNFEIPDDIIQQALDQAESEKKRVLFILNTIEQAQKVYKKIKEKKMNNVFLIHSRFTFIDRKELEQKIAGTKDQKGLFSNPKPSDEKESKILVATQVVEASLDIDADVLYTEIAPIDALVQRMGRVLRRYFYLGNGKVLNKSDESQIELKDNEDLKLFNDPNVFVLVFKNGYESGNGRVYSRELIEKSYELLKKLKNSNLELSEYKKYELVNQLYENLKKDSPYLKDFYKTLEILDAGYMSEKKHEALRIFREIYTIPAIPENKIDEFKKSMEDFVNTNSLNYTRFKMEVLSKYVVNIDIRKYLHDDSLNLKNASYLVNELNGLSEKQYSKLKRWLSDIYVFDGEYDNEIGVIFIKNRSKGKIVD